MAGDTTATSPVSRFPVYLLPSFNIPFRRRRQSSVSTTNYGSPPSDALVPSLGSSPTDSSLSSPLESPPTTPSSYFPSRFSFSKIGRWATTSVDPHSHVTTKLTQTQPNTIRCSHCSTDFAFTSQIVSKGFTGRYGRAYLVSPPENTTGSKGTADLVNILVGKSESRVLVTGSHVVADISCAICRTKVGWKYVDAKEETQKYKVGKFILETARVADYQSWEDMALDELPAPAEIATRSSDVDNEPIVFDSEDEDECEDIFSGTWDPEVAAKRRSKKVNRRPRQAF
ncbi:hypothetical protein PFICI_13105 [Pestalotiopsis fici W106-1]|uniref:Yippee domain-containing protein n=1 Tax=Pestalotiopsis fici (strain W106-1 / CGMCC3.15140) TaxID=1229662 RepID=W3WP81_PESFW|nr:uncharacterized protein PFICI_13105 [Pestalotiopsis fici W106-1]ETS74621.1 hypothetical protein PFICI_13105 [Pestalotiopsis fici W106-1]